MKLIFLTLFIFLCVQLNLKAQEDAGETFLELTNAIKLDYLPTGNYEQIIYKLTDFIDSYPNFSAAGRMLTNFTRKYKNEIMLNGQIISHLMKYKKYIPPDFFDVLLVAYYKENSISKVQEILASLTELDTSEIKFQPEMILQLDPKVNPDLYEQILSSVCPLIVFYPNPEIYVRLYNAGSLNLIDRFYSGEPPHIPLNLLAKVNPELYPELYKTYFAKSLIQSASEIEDSIKANDELVNLLVQLDLAGKTESYLQLKNLIADKSLDYADLYRFNKQLFSKKDTITFDVIQRRVNDQVNSSDTATGVKFNWVISALYLKMYYRAGEFLRNIFLFSKQPEIDYYSQELRWWQRNNLEPAYCNKILAEIHGIENIDNNLPYSSQAPAKEKFGTYYALLIGVQNYKDSTISDLKNPVNDARRLYNVLINDYLFTEKNIALLENPSRNEIIEILFDYRKLLKDSDNLLIFYAGHGLWDEEIGQGYWLPADANSKIRSNWINNSEVRDLIQTINDRHTLLVSDACFSGGIFKKRDMKIQNEKTIDAIYSHTSRKAITSGTLKEVPDESIFLDWFVKKLEQNDEKYLTAEDLFFSLKDAVISNSEQVPLYGTIINTGDDQEGDFIFVKK